MERIYATIEDGKLIPMDRSIFARFVLKLKGEDIVEIRKHVRNRTLPQNSYYWGVVLKLISDSTGFTVEECHQVFKIKFLTYRKTYKNKEYSFVKSTTKLSTLEMTEYIDKIKDFASSELSVYIPDADEYNSLAIQAGI